MRVSWSLATLPVFLLAASAALQAQTMASSSSQAAHSGSPQSNYLPYTFNSTTTMVQTLADGTTITTTFTQKEARDSEGRTYSETHVPVIFRADSPPADLVTCFVTDPVARTRIGWNNRAKIAKVAPMPVAEADTARQTKISHPTQHQTSKNLGVRTIAGIEAKGTRDTGIIPVGEMGNDRPLTTMTEHWVSMQYQIELLTISDDLRMGKRTEEVTAFKPGEPDTALFQMPKGYTIQERNGR